jgi:catechol 2,3-dioxygenase-like lactoylglutathione lyase family enzyme
MHLHTRSGDLAARARRSYRGAMIDHFTLTVPDAVKSRAFYERALAPLGYGVQMEFEGMIGFGAPRKPSFWIKAGPLPQSPMHIAFVAADRAAVDGFHAAALAAGGRDDGPPGLRTHYHANYYGAFILDPDGHPIEAVCHRSPDAPRAAPKKPPRPAPRKKKPSAGKKRKKVVAGKARKRSPRR